MLTKSSAFIAILLLLYTGISAEPSAGDEKELRILSWNIKMLPRLVKRVRVGPVKRSRIIPQQIINDSIDIVVFQEAFDVRARLILKRRLRDDYPYREGPANKKFLSLRTNSGIVIYSKIPIKHLEEIDFDQCEGDDCLARKGALLVQAEFNGTEFQLLGTHLEAGGTREMKTSQYQEISELIERHKKQGVPQLLAGDFNTNKRDEILYPRMLEMLQAEDGELEGDLKYTADELRNDMNPAGRHGPKQSVIDYVLYRGNGVEPAFMVRHVRQYQIIWRVDHSDLSDHNAVLMRIRFN